MNQILGASCCPQIYTTCLYSQSCYDLFGPLLQFFLRGREKYPFRVWRRQPLASLRIFPYPPAQVCTQGQVKGRHREKEKQRRISNSPRDHWRTNLPTLRGMIWHRIPLGNGLLSLTQLLARLRQYSRKMEGIVNFSHRGLLNSVIGSYYFSLVGPSVKIHSVATGDAVSTLSSPEGNGALLTCAILNPHNAFQLLTGSSDGRVMVWDFLDATLLKVIDIAQPIHHICAHSDFKDSVFVAATRSSRKSKNNSTGTSRPVYYLHFSLIEIFNNRCQRRCSPCLP
jgi:WD40 repeat protein